MSTLPQHDDLDGPSKYAPPWVSELIKSRQSFNGVDSGMASDGGARTIVNAPVRHNDDLDSPLPNYSPEFSEATGQEAFRHAHSDPANGRFSQGDLGLAVLISDVKAERLALGHNRIRTVPIENLRPNPRNPRRKELDDDLLELAASIRERGILQPIIARRIPDTANEYEVIAGERRWRAAQRAGLHEVLIVLRDVNDVESLELAIVENVQRTDLSTLEQASAYQALIDQYGYTQDEVASIIGKSRSYVANTLRLLQLSDKVKGLIQSGKLTASHARMLVGLPNADEVAEEIVELALNVREVEARTQGSTRQGDRKTKRSPYPQSNAQLAALQKRLSELLGLPVAIDHRGRDAVIRIRYAQLGQLENLAIQLEALRTVGRATVL